MMTKKDAVVYAKDKIRVNSVHPGFIWTPMVQGYLKSQGNEKEGRKMLDSLHPIAHGGEANDVSSWYSLAGIG